jgi:hypothetical protein
MSFRLNREPDGSLSLAIGGVNRGPVRLLRAAPLSDPDRYISLIDANDDEVTMIADLADLDNDTRALVRRELEHSYPTLTIRRVTSARVESGVAYLTVEISGGGSRDVIVRDVHERMRQFGQRLLISDADDNRFQVPDVRVLDGRSAKLLERVLLRS